MRKLETSSIAYDPNSGEATLVMPVALMRSILELAHDQAVEKGIDKDEVASPEVMLKGLDVAIRWSRPNVPNDAGELA